MKLFNGQIDSLKPLTYFQEYEEQIQYINIKMEKIFIYLAYRFYIFCTAIF